MQFLLACSAGSVIHGQTPQRCVRIAKNSEEERNKCLVKARHSYWTVGTNGTVLLSLEPPVLYIFKNYYIFMYLKPSSWRILHPAISWSFGPSEKHNYYYKEHTNYLCIYNTITSNLHQHQRTERWTENQKYRTVSQKLPPPKIIQWRNTIKKIQVLTQVSSTTEQMLLDTVD